MLYVLRLLLTALLLAAIYLCIYPLPTIAAGTTWWLTAQFLAVVAPHLDESVAIVLRAIPALCVLWIVGRHEPCFEEVPGYRVVRHIFRLALLGGIAHFWYLNWTVDHISPNLPMLERTLRNPFHIPLVLITIVGLHFLFIRGERVRQWWHENLELVRLRVAA